MNEKRFEKFNSNGSAKADLSLADLVSWIISLENKALKCKKIQISAKFRDLKNSIASQKKVSKKVFKSTVEKVEQFEALLNLEIYNDGILDKLQQSNQRAK